MVSKAFGVNAGKLIGAIATELKTVPIIKEPAWLAYSKTGSHNERVSTEEGFWFKRCASLLRTAFTNGTPIGVRRLQNKYGGRIQHTVARSHHRKAGGKIIRLALQQLEKAGYMKKEKVGRTITPLGKKLVEKCANSLAA